MSEEEKRWCLLEHRLNNPKPIRPGHHVRDHQPSLTQQLMPLLLRALQRPQKHHHGDVHPRQRLGRVSGRHNSIQQPDLGVPRRHAGCHVAQDVQRLVLGPVVDDGFKRVHSRPLDGLLGEEVVFDVVDVCVVEVLGDGVDDGGLVFEDELAFGYGGQFVLDDAEVVAEAAGYVDDQRGIFVDGYTVEDPGMQGERLGPVFLGPVGGHEEVEIVALVGVLGQPFKSGKVGSQAILEWTGLLSVVWVAVVDFLEILGELGHAANKATTVCVSATVRVLLSGNIRKTNTSIKSRGSVDLGCRCRSIGFWAGLCDDSSGRDYSHDTS